MSKIVFKVNGKKDSKTAKETVSEKETSKKPSPAESATENETAVTQAQAEQESAAAAVAVAEDSERRSAKSDEKNGVEAVYVTSGGNTAVMAAAGVYAKWQKLSNHKYFILGVRIFLAVLAVTFIILGIVNGNMRAILIKAINICTECIGLG